MAFIPSSYSYGDPAQQDPAKVIEQISPILTALTEQFSDQTMRAEVLDARIENTQDLISRSPSWLKPTLQRRLNVLQARETASGRNVALEEERESSRRTWRTLGQVGVVAGILLLGAGAVRLLRND